MEKQKPMANENVTTECQIQKPVWTAQTIHEWERKLEGCEKHTELNY